MDNLHGVSKETAWQLGYTKGHSDAARHARWTNEFYDENDGHTYAECTYCHHVRIVDNYCPNCGAMMDEVDSKSAALTIDQLKFMRGKPIWFVGTACDGESLERYDIITKITEHTMETALGENVSLENYGKTWLAYPSQT